MSLGCGATALSKPAPQRSADKSASRWPFPSQPISHIGPGSKAQLCPRSDLTKSQSQLPLLTIDTFQDFVVPIEKIRKAVPPSPPCAPQWPKGYSTI